MKSTYKIKKENLKLTALGFTLIELIAVLVIMAILALIVTPLVMNIIRKARISADKRSIDAYGRSVELAIASYLLDTGKFPTSVEQLTIEYSGDEVVCSTTQLNSDSSVYLAGCTVAGRSVDYTYGKEETITYNSYSVGDEVTYNNVDYYVIEDSDENEETVTLLKKEPLSVEEVNLYGGFGTENNHVNCNGCTAGAQDLNGYGGIAYYYGSGCTAYGNGSDCKNDYSLSNIKYVVDAWSDAKIPSGLVEARLLTTDDLTANLGYEITQQCSAGNCNINVSDENKLNWVYNSNYSYRTMTPGVDSTSEIWGISSNGSLFRNSHVYDGSAVRPVITIKKSALES